MVFGSFAAAGRLEVDADFRLASSETLNFLFLVRTKLLIFLTAWFSLVADTASGRAFQLSALLWWGGRRRRRRSGSLLRGLSRSRSLGSLRLVIRLLRPERLHPCPHLLLPLLRFRGEFLRVRRVRGPGGSEACHSGRQAREDVPTKSPAIQGRNELRQHKTQNRWQTERERERERVRSGVTYLLETPPLGRFACAMAMVLARTAEVLRAAALAAPGGILIPLLCSAKLVKRSKRRHPHPWKRGSLCCCACVCVSEFS